MGPTGGFLLACPFMAWIAGCGAEHGGKKGLVASLLAADLVCYLAGTLMYSFYTGNSIRASLAVCVLPFLGTDLLKTVLAGWGGVRLRKMLRKAGL